LLSARRNSVIHQVRIVEIRLKGFGNKIINEEQDKRAAKRDTERELQFFIFSVFAKRDTERKMKITDL